MEGPPLGLRVQALMGKNIALLVPQSIPVMGLAG